MCILIMEVMMVEVDDVSVNGLMRVRDEMVGFVICRRWILNCYIFFDIYRNIC